MSAMANYWAARGKKVTLITLASEATDFYALHSGIKRVALGLTAVSRHPWEALRNNLRRLKRLRQEMRASDPDVVISFIDWINVLTLLSGLSLNKLVIVSIRTDPRKSHYVGRLWSTLRRLLYPRAHAVVVPSDDVRRWTQRFVRKERIHTIPNPVTLPASNPNDAAYTLGPGRTVVAVGRLHPVKGYDLLIQAFARCAEEHPDWSLAILGEGEERGRLEALADELGVADRVGMPGRVKNLTKLLRQADLFVMSSRYEGLPIALLEAMACGLPVISTDCSGGPREIVRDGVDGVLVAPEDVGALGTAMGRLMSDGGQRERLASRAVEVNERFGLEKVMAMWEDVLGQVFVRKSA